MFEPDGQRQTRDKFSDFQTFSRLGTILLRLEFIPTNFCLLIPQAFTELTERFVMRVFSGNNTNVEPAKEQEQERLGAPHRLRSCWFYKRTLFSFFLLQPLIFIFFLWYRFLYWQPRLLISVNNTYWYPCQARKDQPHYKKYYSERQEKQRQAASQTTTKTIRRPSPRPSLRNRHVLSHPMVYK